MSKTKDAAISQHNACDVWLYRINWADPSDMDRRGLQRGQTVGKYRIVGYTCDPGYKTGDVFSMSMVMDGKRQTYAIGMRGNGAWKQVIGNIAGGEV